MYPRYRLSYRYYIRLYYLYYIIILCYYIRLYYRYRYLLKTTLMTVSFKIFSLLKLTFHNRETNSHAFIFTANVHCHWWGRCKQRWRRIDVGVPEGSAVGFGPTSIAKVSKVVDWMRRVKLRITKKQRKNGICAFDRVMFICLKTFFSQDVWNVLTLT